MVLIRAESLSLVYAVHQKMSLASRDRHLGRAGGIVGGSGRHRYVQALDDVSFELRAGDRLGLLGTNGAGKSTLLQLLYGIYQPTAGTLSIRGKVDALFNIGLGFRPEATGRRNIELRGLINGWSKAEIAHRMDEIIDFSELGDFIDMPFKSYSQGMAARLAFATATSFEPEILLMDEWIGAGDAAFQQKARTRMQDLASRAGIVILASHNPELIRKTCNKTMTLDKGRKVAWTEDAGVAPV